MEWPNGKGELLSSSNSKWHKIYDLWKVPTTSKPNLGWCVREHVTIETRGVNF